MGRSVRISEEAARAWVAWYDARALKAGCFYADPERGLRRALARLDRVFRSKPPRKPKAFFVRFPKHVPPRSRKPSKEEKRDETAAIRTACFARVERAGGLCECGCGLAVRDDDKGAGCYPEARGELDHFFGRGKVKQSVETCWILRADCHREKTNNRPDAATWLRKFIAHCDRLIGAGERSYCEAANAASRRFRYDDVRSSLPAAPRTR